VECRSLDYLRRQSLSGGTRWRRGCWLWTCLRGRRHVNLYERVSEMLDAREDDVPPADIEPVEGGVQEPLLRVLRLSKTFESCVA
jgi:hypothetical protein